MNTNVKTYEQLIEEAQKLMQEAETMRMQKINEVLEEVKKKIVDYKITADMLQLPDFYSTQNVTVVAAPEPKEKAARKPSEIKFRHPENHELTWTGKGIKPRWLAALLDANKDKDMFDYYIDVDNSAKARAEHKAKQEAKTTDNTDKAPVVVETVVDTTEAQVEEPAVIQKPKRSFGH